MLDVRQMMSAALRDATAALAAIVGLALSMLWARVAPVPFAPH